MMNIKHVHWCICCILSVTKVVLLAQSFSLTPRPRHHQPCHHRKVIFALSSAAPNDVIIKNLCSESSTSSSYYVNASLLESLRSMRVKEIKSELDSLRVSTSDVFEKEELVQRLYSARIMQQQGTKTNNVADDRGNELIKKKKRRLYDDDVDNENLVEESPRGSSDGGHNWSITTPFTYFQLGPSQPVTARVAHRELSKEGFGVTDGPFFDTFTVNVSTRGMTSAQVQAGAVKVGANVRIIDDKPVGISMGEGITRHDVSALLSSAFGISKPDISH